MKAKLLITKGRIISINLKNLIKFANKDKTKKKSSSFKNYQNIYKQSNTMFQQISL